VFSSLTYGSILAHHQHLLPLCTELLHLCRSLCQKLQGRAAKIGVSLDTRIRQVGSHLHIIMVPHCLAMRYYTPTLLNDSFLTAAYNYYNYTATAQCFKCSLSATSTAHQCQYMHHYLALSSNHTLPEFSLRSLPLTMMQLCAHSRCAGYAHDILQRCTSWLYSSCIRLRTRRQ
jgi:hypothetical protein